MSPSSLAAPWLRLAARAYARAVALRNRRYDRPGASRRAPLPVLSVGNLTVGGTGKTPLVGWLAARLVADGRRPAVVSRGYGGDAGRGPLVVSRGDGPSCDAGRAGDEPFLLAETLRGVSVVVGSDRLAGARAAAGLGCDVVVLDDGFQHRRLARDLDLVLLDATDPFGGDRLLPAGRLREPLEGLGRADVVVITRSAAECDHPEIERVVRRHNRTAPVLRAGHRPTGFFDARGRSVPVPTRVLAFCGIGNPRRFRLDLERAGATCVDFEAFRDHHRYSAAQIRRLVERAARADAVPVTTEKDRVRLPDPPGADGLLTLRIEAELYGAATLCEAVRSALRAGSAA